jgi:DNA-binding response OmpR family regulator
MARRPQKTAKIEGDPLTVLIVDGGRLITEELMEALTEGGFHTNLVSNTNYALSRTRGERYDAVIINSDFAKVDALWLCQALRVQGCLSVIVVVSGGPSTTDELAAFRAGATDRVGHDVPRSALVERILAHIAGARIRVAGLLYPVTAELPTTAGRCTMSLVPTLVALDGRPLSFTRTEERLFARLWAAEGAVVSPDELIRSGWLGQKVRQPTLRVHVHELRKKLGRLGLSIEHVEGDESEETGYRFAPLVPPS